LRSFLERLFRVRDHGSTVRTELLGGLTTFLTMAYIIVVNPAILSFIHIPEGPSTVATILAAVFGTLLMGLYANRPIAVAPYMGENAFIAFGLGLGSLANGWKLALGAVFVSGAAFALLSLLRIRSWLANSISPSMKHSFAVGIGLFLLFIGLYQTGIVTSSVTGMKPAELRSTKEGTLQAPPAPMKIGDWHNRTVQLAIAGFALTMGLLYWRVRGAILLGIALTAAAGYALGVGQAPKSIVALPWDEKYDLSAIAFQLDIPGVLQLQYLPLLLTLFLMSFLDTLGTLIGVGSAAGMLDKQGNFPQIEKPMLVDASACMFSALIGTSTSGAFIESATGIREGARTGLAPVATAALFAVALFFMPLVEPLQHLQYAYGPALMAVGVLMLPAVTRIDFNDLTETVPALTTIALMLFTYNIGNGLTAGLVLYPVFKLATGRLRDLNAGSVVLGGMCLVYFVFGITH
jgi:AGZA family xanthine/uracil permease-like MFS transporter